MQRRFEATGINELWVADMTYVPTWAGFGYMAVLLHRESTAAWWRGRRSCCTR